jgi:3',5'-cyclic AMP phosphodiesterase CpdA
MSMRLWAIADLHLGRTANRAALAALPGFGADWLIVAGDVGERAEQLDFAFAELTPRFARVLWVPGNHELWTAGDGPDDRGEAKYRALVALARRHGVVTPEDDFPLWTGPGGPCVLAPLFLLYDYSFRPDWVAAEEVVAWARAERIVSADERLLDPSPHPSRAAWCAVLCDAAEARLSAIPDGLPTILINHFPLRYDMAVPPFLPRFSPWCGTRRTEDWHRRFRATAVVYGHLHLRRTLWRDGTRFEEVSLGYPRQWDPRRGLAPYLRRILPS